MAGTVLQGIPKSKRAQRPISEMLSSNSLLLKGVMVVIKERMGMEIIQLGTLILTG